MAEVIPASTAGCGSSGDLSVPQLLAEREVAAAALREARAKLQAVFEGVETGIFVIDPESHRIVDANPVALELTGAPREKMLGALCHRFVCPAEEGRCPVTDLGQTVDNSERVLLTQAGEKRSIIKTVRPVQIDGHRYLLESFLDISQRKRAEKALEEQTAYLNTLFETSPLGIVVLDEDERIQMSNTALERLFLYSREEMQGQRLNDLLAPDDLASEAGHFSRECLAGRSAHFTSQRRRKDNALVDVEIFGVPLVVAGRPQGILALYQDVTGRRQVEAERAERHRLATLAAEVGLALTGAEDLSDGLQQCVDALIRNTDIAFAQIWTCNEKEHRLELEASADIQLHFGPDRLRMDLSLLERIAETGVTQLDGTFVGSPLKVREQVLGVAAAFACQPLTEAALQAFESVVHSIAQFAERKRAEGFLRESEDRFRTAFEEAPHGMCITALDGRFLHANAALSQMLGYTAQELQAGAWQEITHPDDLERSRQVRIEFGKGVATTLGLEKRYIHKRGNPVWVKVTISVVKDRSGSPSHFITQVEDITLRRQADEAQAFLVSLVESSQDAIIGTTPEGVVVSWNRGAAELYGYGAEEMIGKTAAAVIPPECPDELPSILQSIQRREALASHETMRIRKDGRRVEISLNTSPVFDAAGKITGAVHIARDITRRKVAEERLRASEQRYRELFENASDLVYTFDLDLHITSLNRVAKATMGYAGEEAIGMDLRQLVDPEGWTSVEEAMARLVSGHPAAKIELEIETKDGRSVTLEMNPRLIYRDGQAVGIQAIARDITGRDAAEMELRQAQKLESVGRLASGIAHEINTPMQFVGDNVRFLQDSFGEMQPLIRKVHELCQPSAVAPLPPELCHLAAGLDCDYLLKEIPEALTQTLDGVDRVVTIVRAMKEFAHPENKGMIPADLNKALLNTLTVARNELKYVADVETQFGDLPLVVCSLSDLNQVFVNLLVNAAHAIAETVKGTGQRGRIMIQTSREGPMALITIADTGAGIPEGIRDRIFDPFFTTKEVGRGTGQGLAIARSVVDRHKGTLTFETEVGKGTTFLIRLPIEGSEPSAALRS